MRHHFRVVHGLSEVFPTADGRWGHEQCHTAAGCAGRVSSGRIAGVFCALMVSWCASAAGAGGDGKVVFHACSREQPRGPGVYVAEWDFRDPVRLTNLTPVSSTRAAAGAACDVAALTADGTRLAVSRGGDLYVGDLTAVVSEHDRGLKPVLDERGAPVYGWAPAWSPDGQRIALHTARSGLFVVNADGSGRRLLLRWPAAGGEIREHEWSPDGKAIVLRMGPLDASHLYLLTDLEGPGGPKLRQLTGNPAYMECWPHWSPDGKQIMFTRGPAGQAWGGPGADVWIIDLATNHETQITRTPDRQETGRGWCPVDGKIYFTETTAEPGSASAIVRMRPDGSERERFEAPILPVGGLYWLPASPVGAAASTQPSTIGAAPAAAGAAAPGGEPVPRIVFDTVNCDLGEVVQGEEASQELSFRNSGGSLLRIEKVEDSCGCTAAVFGKRELAPGESSTIKVTLKTAGYRGRVSQQVRVYTNDPSAPMVALAVSATVIVEAETSPKGIYLGKVRVGEMVERTIKVLRVDAPSLAITSVESDHPALRVSPAEPMAEGDGSYTLRIIFGPENEAGRVIARITIRTNLERTKELAVSVYGRVVENQEGQQASQLSLPAGLAAIELPEAYQAYQEKSALFLDAREPEEYARGHVPGALNLPADNFEDYYLDIADQVETAPALLVYCESQDCGEAIQVATRLLECVPGKAIHVLGPGWPAWVEAGYPRE